MKGSPMKYIELQDIANIRLGININQSKESDILPKNHHYNILSLKNFAQSVCLKENFISENLVRAVPLNEKFIIRKNDILIKLVAPILAIFIQNAPPNLIYPHSMAKISLISADFNPKFLAYYIHYATALKRQLLANTLQSTAVSLIKLSDLSKIQIPLITIHEQEKIVRILTLTQRKDEILHSLILQNQNFSKAILDKFTQNTNSAQRTAQ